MDLPAVEVIWIDAHGGGVSWGKKPKQMSHEPDQVRTVGLLHQSDDVGTTVVLSMTQRGHTDAYIFIPAECVRKITYLQRRGR